MPVAAHQRNIHKIVPYRLENSIIYREKSGIFTKLFQQFINFVDIGSAHGTGDRCEEAKRRGGEFEVLREFQTIDVGRMDELESECKGRK